MVTASDFVTFWINITFSNQDHPQLFMFFSLIIFYPSVSVTIQLLVIVGEWVNPVTNVAFARGCECLKYCSE